MIILSHKSMFWKIVLQLVSPSPSVHREEYVRNRSMHAEGEVKEKYSTPVTRILETAGDIDSHTFGLLKRFTIARSSVELRWTMYLAVIER